MEMQHKFECEEEDVFVFPKVEVTLNEIENSDPIESVRKEDDFIGSNDPLLVVKEETDINSVTETNRIVINDYLETIDEFLAEENSIEK